MPVDAPWREDGLIVTRGFEHLLLIERGKQTWTENTIDAIEFTPLLIASEPDRAPGTDPRRDERVDGAARW